MSKKGLLKCVALSCRNPVENRKEVESRKKVESRKEVENRKEESRKGERLCRHERREMQRNTERDRGEKGRIMQEGTISGSREEAQERTSGLVGEDRQ